MDYDNYLDIQKITKTTDFEATISSWGFTFKRQLQGSTKLNDFYETVQNFVEGYVHPSTPEASIIEQDRYTIEVKDVPSEGESTMPISYLNEYPMKAPYWRVAGTEDFEGTVTSKKDALTFVGNGKGQGFLYFKTTDDFPHKQLNYRNTTFLDHTLLLKGDLDKVVLLVTSQIDSKTVRLADYKKAENSYELNLASILPNINVVAFVLDTVKNLTVTVNTLGRKSMQVPHTLVRSEFLQGALKYRDFKGYTPTRVHQILKALGVSKRLTVRLQCTEYDESDTTDTIKPTVTHWLKDLLNISRLKGNRVILYNDITTTREFRQCNFGGDSVEINNMYYLPFSRYESLGIMLSRSRACLTLQMEVGAWLQVGYYDVKYLVEGDSICLYDPTTKEMFTRATTYPAPDYESIYRTDLVDTPFGEYAHHCNTLLGTFTRDLLNATEEMLTSTFRFAGNPLVDLECDLGYFTSDKDTIEPRMSYAPLYLRFNTGNVLSINATSAYISVDAKAMYADLEELAYPKRNNCKSVLVPNNVPVTHLLLNQGLGNTREYFYLHGTPVVIGDLFEFSKASAFIPNLNTFFLNGERFDVQS